MNQDFIDELELLTNQKLVIEPTKLGYLVELKPTLKLHFILLDNIKTNLNLIEWKAKNQLQDSISIFEDEWLNKKAFVLSRLKSKLGLNTTVYARKTSVQKLNRSEAYDFLLANHINDALKAKYNFGIMLDNEIVAIACFGPIMHKKTEGKGDMSGELIRFCNKLDTTVVGGLSKLLTHFIKEYQVDDVMTYIDRDWSDGKSFSQLGFKVVGENTSFNHYLNTEIKQFEVYDELNENQLTVCKSGLLKLLLKVGK